MRKAGEIILKDEKESRSTIVKDGKAKVHHVTKHPKAGLVVCDWEFDFNGVSAEEIIKLASRGLVIDARGAFKGLDVKEVEGAATQVLSVKEMLTTQKRGKSPAEKVKDLFANMTPEQIAEAIKEAQA